MTIINSTQYCTHLSSILATDWKCFDLVCLWRVQITAGHYTFNFIFMTYNIFREESKKIPWHFSFSFHFILFLFILMMNWERRDRKKKKTSKMSKNKNKPKPNQTTTATTTNLPLPPPPQQQQQQRWRRRRNLRRESESVYSNIEVPVASTLKLIIHNKMQI